MVLPDVYRKSPLAVASYDWLDITSGTGYRRYYGCASDLDAGISYFLTTRTLDGRPVSKASTGTEIDLDFDITFNTPAIVKGIANVNLTYLHTTGPASQCRIYIYHVTSGGTETQIGTALSKNTAGGVATGKVRECLTVSLTEKAFAANEKLRLTVQPIANVGVAIEVWHDPGTKLTYADVVDTRTIGTDIVLECPFKIDL